MKVKISQSWPYAWRLLYYVLLLGIFSSLTVIYFLYLFSLHSPPSTPPLPLPLCTTTATPDSNDTVTPFGTFHSLLKFSSQKHCYRISTHSFALTNPDRLGYRLPFYAQDASKIYRCRLLTRFVDPSFDPPPFRECCLQSHFNASSSLSSELVLLNLDEFNLWLDAINRIGQIVQGNVPKQFYLISQELEWQSLLPSIPGQLAFPDVNTHVMRLPPRFEIPLLHGEGGGVVDAKGRVVFGNMDVFYPLRAPYSHVSLMETPTKTLHKFVPNQESRIQLEHTLRKEGKTVQECLDLFSIQASPHYVCGRYTVVDQVFVLSQTLGNQMFHFLCEGLPRLGAFLPLLLDNPNIYIHVNCPERAGYCLPLLDKLGFPAARIVRGNVIARKILLPEGGRRHWPIGNIWGLLALRERVLRDQSDKEECLVNGQVRVVIIKRSKTRLSHVQPNWYDKLSHYLSTTLVSPFFPSVKKLDVTLFEDTNQTVMSHARLQIDLLRQADIVIGAHGAALSWMTYAKRCTHFISFRARGNSDIFEQLALGLGIPFTHVRFENEYNALARQVYSSASTALLTLLTKSPPALLTQRWMSSPDLLLFPNAETDWVVASQFHTVRFVRRLTGDDGPLLAWFQTPDRPQDRVVTVVCPLVGTVLEESSQRLFYKVQPQDGVSFDALVSYVESFGDFSLSSKALHVYGIYFHQNMTQQWSPPRLSMFQREPASLKTMGRFGKVLYVQVPFGFQSEIQCRVRKLGDEACL